MAKKREDKEDAKNPKQREKLLKPGAVPGRYPVGNNLYLKVGRGDRQRSWTYFYRWQGKLTEHGLGSAHSMSLADARKAATACRAQLDQGVKPGSPAGTEAGTAPAFGEVADSVIEAKAGGWKGDGGRKRWTYALSRRRGADGKIDASGFCQKLVNRPVNTITTQDVLDVLTPIWMTKNKSAALLRSQIEAVLHAGGRRGADNPATLETLKHSLAKQPTTVTHCPAMPYADAPALMQRLRADNGSGARLLEFLILTWTRTDEAREARWSEIDRANAVWTIPPHRTKKNREHRVPLSARALEILDEMAADRPKDCDGSSYIFPGSLPGKPWSTSVMPDTMQRLGAGAYSVHGWRSCARDWAGETTAHPHDICEAALAHLMKDKTAAAYMRGDLLAKRARLMADWARHLAGESAARGPLRRRRVMFRRRPALAIAA